MQNVLPYLYAALAFVGAASVFAKFLAAGLPALRSHAYRSSWKAESGLVEAYATFVLFLVHICDGALWALKLVSLNVKEEK
jgi:hypothetical protein